MNDRDNGADAVGSNEDGARALDDILTGAFAGRSGHARPGAGSIRDVRLRARRRARRRTTLGGGMIVAVGALGIAYSVRNDDGPGPRLATGDGAGTPFATDGPGVTGPWECTGLMGTANGAGAMIASTIPWMPDPVPTTTLPGYDGSMTVTSTTIDPPVGISTASIIDDVASSTTIATTSTVAPDDIAIAGDTVAGGSMAGDVPSVEAGSGADTTYTLQSCTFVGAVPDQLESGVATDEAASAAQARLAQLQAEEAALRAQLAEQRNDTGFPMTESTGTQAPTTTVTATFDPVVTVPAVLVDGPTATAG